MPRTQTKPETETVTPEVVTETNPTPETETATATPETVPSETDLNTQSNNGNGVVLERDEFASSEYLDPYAKLPRLQALRGTSPEKCGYFISIEQLAKAGWLDFDSIVDNLTTYTYESSGNQEQGLMMPKPRMLVCVKSPLLGFDRQATKEEEQLIILGHWKRQYKEDDNIGNCQLYEVILLDQENKPLHTVPLSYVAKGANQATFSQEWQKFLNQLTVCHAITNAIAARPKDARFKSLCVFNFSTKREIVGKKQKSFACRVSEHEVPNLDNWRSYFVGFDRTLKELIWEGLQPTQPLLIPGETIEVSALPASPDEDG